MKNILILFSVFFSVVADDDAKLQLIQQNNLKLRFEKSDQYNLFTTYISDTFTHEKKYNDQLDVLADKGDAAKMEIVALKRDHEIQILSEWCCRALTAPCLACHAGTSVKVFCDKNPDSIGCKHIACTMDMYTCPDGTLLSRNSEDCEFPACPVKKPPQCANCTKWFDGCNQCKCDADGNKKCTLKVCPKPRTPMCLDDDECDKAKSWSLDKSDECCDTGDCLDGNEKHNCLTKEVWTNKKRKWCCKFKSIGCEYLDCPLDCSSWFDGCNTCTCKEGILGGCTKKFCFRQEKPKCLDTQCPRDCTQWFDGCNTCTCNNGELEGCTRRHCLYKKPAKCLEEPCAVVDCKPGYTKIGADKKGCGGKCAKYDCLIKQVWSLEKRAWCCIHERRGCCPVVRCAAPRKGCTRKMVKDINKFGCLVYPCGKDVCLDTTEKKPQITVKDSRGIARLSVSADDDNDTSKVTIQIMDKKGRTRVSLGAQDISMKNTQNIIRRRNIVRAIVEIEDGVVMDIEKAGVKMNYKTYLKKHNITDIMFVKARNKTRDTNDCNEADINLVRDDTNTMAYEIVLQNPGDNAFNCYNGIPLSLLTLNTNNTDDKNEYSVKCWSGGQWVFKGTLKESEEYACERLPGYRHIIGSQTGTVGVNGAQANCDELVDLYTDSCGCVHEPSLLTYCTNLQTSYRQNCDECI